MIMQYTDLVKGEIYKSPNWIFRFVGVDPFNIRSDFAIYVRGENNYGFRTGIHGWNLNEIQEASEEDKFFLLDSIKRNYGNGETITKPEFKSENYAIF